MLFLLFIDILRCIFKNDYTPVRVGFYRECFRFIIIEQNYKTVQNGMQQKC